MNPIRMLLSHLYYRVRGRRIYAIQGTRIRGLQNITTHGKLSVGREYVGFLTAHDRAYLNINGQLVINDYVSLGKGCRLDIGREATCTLTHCSVTGDSRFIIMHGLTVGAESVISWGCEFLDDDFHTLEYEGRPSRDPRIVLGERVWVGSHARFLKGARVAPGSMVASGAVVTRAFDEPNVLLAGNPARIVKHNIRWY